MNRAPGAGYIHPANQRNPARKLLLHPARRRDAYSRPGRRPVFGPSKAVEAVQGFIGGTKKSAAATDASPDPVLPEKSAKTKRRARAQEKAAQMTDLSSIAPLGHSPIPAPVQVDARQSPRSARIIAGMTRADLVALWGAPDIRTTAVVHGRLTETYSYGYRPHSPARLMILEDGRVTSTGDISTP